MGNHRKKKKSVMSSVEVDSLKALGQVCIEEGILHDQRPSLGKLMTMLGTKPWLVRAIVQECKQK